MASGHVVVVEEDAETGRRMKYYSRAADAEYWTDLWNGLAGRQRYDRERRGHLPYQLRQTFARWVERGARVLEAGCGLGHFTVAAHALGYRAEGLDWSDETIRRCRRLFPGIPWHVGDVRKLEFADGAFDAVYSPGVCEHFEEGPTGILGETHRVLRTGGVAVISTPCFNPWLQARSARFAAREHAGEFYQYAFTQEGMVRLLERIGFEVVQLRPYGAIQTMTLFAGWRVHPLAAKLLAVALDHAPMVREWGYSCIWVARRVGRGGSR
jgi:SAM-dependent methyltransferase